ncbi:MAG: ethanolamine utilization protein EutJ [Desulfobacterales bacterium]|nr:MAG: ethanolamine utilization protein EutJ [Desulfobacterales bacterium]
MTDYGAHLRSIVNRPENWNFSGAGQLYAGVDLGTYKAITIVVDETGRPRAARMQIAEVVRSGLIVDYAGARNIVSEMIEEIRDASPLPIEKGATSYPPQTEYANINATRYILEGVGLEVLNVLDEPTAANQVLKLQNGAIVDVGGGTTGIAVIQNGNVAYTDDEATGGVHLSLVLAGNYKISYEEAEQIKTDKQRSREVLTIVRPVIEKIASIASSHLEKFDNLEKVCLVGGTCELEGFTEIVAQNIGMEAFRPAHPQFITPFGIALSCLNAEAGDLRT